MAGSGSKRLWLLAVAGALFVLVSWLETKAPGVRAGPFGVDFIQAGAAFCFAFVCFTLLGAYDERPRPPGDERLTA